MTDAATCAATPALLLKKVRELGREQSKSYAGSFLVAHPTMLDPNFRRAVLFVSAHTFDDGAIGIILNRPLEKKLSELVTETPPDGLENVPVFFGGPVQRDRLMFAAVEWKSGEGLQLNPTVNLEEANERASSDPNSVRAFIGYAGWSAGQLEAEMKQNAWIAQKANRAALKIEQLPKLWFDIMRGLGPWFKMLSAAPDDPSLN
jgi:putative transcriptional regulator